MPEQHPTKGDVYLISQMHKAIAIIQFKLEHQIISRHPEYAMEVRNLLHKIDYEEGTIDLSFSSPMGAMVSILC